LNPVQIQRRELCSISV